MAERDSVGLCLTCRWARTVTNRRGSTFFRCGRADTDPGFPRYPPLPVLQCRGYEPRPSPEGTGGGRPGAVTNRGARCWAARGRVGPGTSAPPFGTEGRAPPLG